MLLSLFSLHRWLASGCQKPGLTIHSIKVYSKLVHECVTERHEAKIRKHTKFWFVSNQNQPGPILRDKKNIYWKALHRRLENQAQKLGSNRRNIKLFGQKHWFPTSDDWILEWPPLLPQPRIWRLLLALLPWRLDVAATFCFGFKVCTKQVWLGWLGWWSCTHAASSWENSDHFF